MPCSFPSPWNVIVSFSLFIVQTQKGTVLARPCWTPSNAVRFVHFIYIPGTEHVTERCAHPTVHPTSKPHVHPFVHLEILHRKRRIASVPLIMMMVFPLARAELGGGAIHSYARD
jgi:hypothetical protein